MVVIRSLVPCTFPAWGRKSRGTHPRKPGCPEPQCVNETAPVESPLNAHCRPNIERIIRWTLRDDDEDELGQGLREVKQDIVEVIAEFEGEL